MGKMDLVSFCARIYLGEIRALNKGIASFRCASFAKTRVGKQSFKSLCEKKSRWNPEFFEAIPKYEFVLWITGLLRSAAILSQWRKLEGILFLWLLFHHQLPFINDHSSKLNYSLLHFPSSNRVHKTFFDFIEDNGSDD